MTSAPTPFCPCGARCESCGGEDGPMGVLVLGAGERSLCITCCPRCAGPLAAGARLPITAATTVRLIAEHARHRAASPYDDGRTTS